MYPYPYFKLIFCSKFLLKGECHLSSVAIYFLPFLAVKSVHPVCTGYIFIHVVNKSNFASFMYDKNLNKLSFIICIIINFHSPICSANAQFNLILAKHFSFEPSSSVRVNRTAIRDSSAYLSLCKAICNSIDYTHCV